jgi:hypothetical protein
VPEDRIRRRFAVVALVISCCARVTFTVDPALVSEAQCDQVLQASRLVVLDRGAGTLTLTFDVDDESVGDAARAACSEARVAVAAAGIAGTADGVECMTSARFMGQALTPEVRRFFDVVGTAEVAEILSISRPRLDRVRKTHPDFPAPLAELRSGPVWGRAWIMEFDQGWERKRTGRPRKQTGDG